MFLNAQQKLSKLVIVFMQMIQSLKYWLNSIKQIYNRTRKYISFR